MSEVKHTPGPWSVSYLDKNGKSVVKAEHIEVATCWHHCVGAIEKEMHYNARLIAAAPELLEALIEYMRAVAVMNAAMNDGINVHGALSVMIGATDNAEAAIAKATGEAK